jgi:glycosyltransferase involved in cell wall biosynthesis
MSKKVLMVLPVLKGGGAERVASILTNEFHKNGYTCEFLLTSCNREAVISRDLDENIPVIILRDFFEKSFADSLYKLLQIFTSAICKPFEKIGLKVPTFFAYLSFIANYHKEIKALKKVIKERENATVVTFLQPSIPMVLLAGRKTKNKIIISERGDPKRQMKHRYGYKFIKKYYKRVDKAVFQTEDAKNAYPKNIAVKGTVIFNPIKENLPERYVGERNKNITTFCRISYQKNLPVLVKAFEDVHKDFPDYRLRIIGNTQNADDEKALKETKDLIEELKIADFVDFEPFSLNVHSEIIEDAVYVNSSDYEGMSNAMLEAMAIGMPVVCTDCPIGGAKAVIKNGENGVLVPVGDAEGLAEAIKKVITDNELATTLSGNAVKIKDELSLSNIARKWMELI